MKGLLIKSLFLASVFPTCLTFADTVETTSSMHVTNVRLEAGMGTGAWTATKNTHNPLGFDVEADFLVSDTRPIYLGPEITYFQYGTTPSRIYQTLLTGYYLFGDGWIHPQAGFETGVTYNSGKRRDLLGATFLLRPGIEFDVVKHFSLAGQFKWGLIQNAKVDFGRRSNNTVDQFFFTAAQVNALYSF